ncbi:hypothetical protein [Thalassobellus suaedae]|uniref:Uncharacterized protein n=1 Tax=Thalassobellus suaedae TaxID=3074124 RepID=A0ABY9Y3P3_9FLAO|nr:hypothetical protein RHP49_01015 [Flavobacteriaceae bacterium HL-DH10]
MKDLKTPTIEVILYNKEEVLCSNLYIDNKTNDVINKGCYVYIKRKKTASIYKEK